MSRVSLVLHALICHRCTRMETLSAHAHGERGALRWRVVAAVVDVLARPWGKRHCEEAWRFWNALD